MPFLSLGPFDSYRHTLTLAGSLKIKNGNSSDNVALLGRGVGGKYFPSLTFKTCCFAY